MTNYVLDSDNQQDLFDGIEYVVIAWCNQNKLSGELAWLLIQSLSTAKLETYKGRL